MGIQQQAGAIHMYVGDVNRRGVKTACKVALEDLPRCDGSVPYRLRQSITCPVCEAVALKTERMRSI